MGNITDPLARYVFTLIDDTKESDEFDVTEGKWEKMHTSLNNEFLDTFSQRFWRYMGLVVVVLVSLFIIDLVACGSLPNQAYGLGLDLLGAAILGRGLLNTPENILRRAANAYGYNSTILRSLSHDIIDGIWGIFLLITGIIVQFIAINGVSLDLVGTCLV